MATDRGVGTSTSRAGVERDHLLTPLAMWAMVLWFMGLDSDLDHYTFWLGMAWVGVVAALVVWMVVRRPRMQSPKAASPSDHLFNGIVAVGLGWTMVAAAWDGRLLVSLVSLGALTVGTALMLFLRSRATSS
ncbi:hypothetical protein FCL41_16685 [Nocardioides jishulii]|uniref:hypothetical protein n=1 Tax=Nocardioides jishulii TaxID=2575440 RepID=UPI00110E7132|nr:hypothetical protein [Nocardioides jishulii]QCX28972.1 hypothetical protein FCL41_16685 [Nocardioides jishulii]